MSTANILFTRKNLNASRTQMTARFPTTMLLGPDNEVAMVSGTFYNSFYNITAAKGNNTLIFAAPWYRSNGTMVMKSYTVPFADGYYSIEDMNNVLTAFCVTNNVYVTDTDTGNIITFISIQANAALYKAQINCFSAPTETTRPANWLGPSVTFTESGVPVVRTLIAPTGAGTTSFQVTINTAFGVLLGFDAGSYPPAPITDATGSWSQNPTYVATSPSAPDINAVSSVVVTCNLVQSSFSVPSSLIGQIPISARFGGMVQFASPYPTFAPVLQGGYSDVTLAFYDQNFNPITFFDPDVTMTVQVRKRQQQH